MKQKLKCCNSCKQLKPVSNFYIENVKRKANNDAGFYISKRYKAECIDCHLKRMKQQNEYKKAQELKYNPYSENIEYYNYEGVKCKIERIEKNTYKASTKDISLYYTHLSGLSGTLEMNKEEEYINAGNFINKTYEHRMLLFKEICNLQNEINLNKAIEEIKYYSNLDNKENN